MNSTQKSIKVLSKVKAPVFTGLDGEVYMKGVVLSINPKITDQDQDCIIKLTEDYSERGNMFSINNHITVKIMLLESVDEDKLSYKQWLESIDIRKNIIDGYSPTGQPLTPEEIKRWLKANPLKLDEEEAFLKAYPIIKAHKEDCEVLKFNEEEGKYIDDLEANAEKGFIEETYSETTQHIFDLESKIMGLQAENSLLQRENNSFKLINDTVLTDKGQKKLDKALNENKLLKLKLDNMAINEKDYQLQAIKLITDKACLSKELADIKGY